MRSNPQLPKPMRRTFFRIYLVAGGSLILLSLAFYLVGFRPLATALRDEHAQRIDISLEATLQRIHAEIEKHQGLAEQIGSRSAIRDKLRQYEKADITLEALQRFSHPKLTDAIRAHEDILGMTRIGSDGKRLVDVGLTPSDTVIARCDTEAGQIHLLPPVVVAGSHRLVYCSPITTWDGTLLGTDAVVIREASIQQIIEHPLHNGVIHFAIYADGSMIYPRNSGQIPALIALRSYRAGTSDETADFLVRERTLDNCDWRLYAVIDENRFFQDINQQMAALLGGLAAIALLLFSLTVRVLKPVIRALLREEELIDRSHRDGLTGLYNQIHLKESLQRELARTQRNGGMLSVLMLDLDHFKDVNDAYGHLAGDDVLRTVSHILRQNARQQDIVGRYGGEEFMVLLPETDRAGAERMAERIRHSVETATTSTEAGDIRTTVSIGAGTFGPEAKLSSVDHVIGETDRALYASKRAGRNRTTHLDARAD